MLVYFQCHNAIKSQDARRPTLLTHSETPCDKRQPLCSICYRVYEHMMCQAGTGIQKICMNKWGWFSYISL